MNVRPIDLQVLIPQTSEVGKTQHVANQQTALDQQVFAEQWKQISAERQQQVQNLLKSEGGKVSSQSSLPDKQKSKKRATKSNNANKSENLQSCEAQTHEDPVRGLIIDIKT